MLQNMSRSAEELFHKALQAAGPYKGRHDLSSLPPTIRDQLRLIQQTFNEALRNEKQNVPEHVEHPPFHLDFIDSSIPNALAFQYQDHSFIGITIALVYSVSDVCLSLSTSETIATLTGVQPSREQYNGLHAVLFSVLLAFIVSHEYTHHVHGHAVSELTSGSLFLHEILDAGHIHNLDAQIQEVVADGYAIYHVLANFLNGAGRSWLVVLGLSTAEVSTQDQVLLSLVVIAAGAYLVLRQPPPLSPADIYKLSHPPQIVRMECLMQEVLNWCRQNRPELQTFMTPSRYQQLMNAAIETSSSDAAVHMFADQARFCRSESGQKYITELHQGVNAYKRLL